METVATLAICSWLSYVASCGVASFGLLSCGFPVCIVTLRHHDVNQWARLQGHPIHAKRDLAAFLANSGNSFHS